jgi:hypothetical protein
MAELGVQVESPGLVMAWAYAVGTPNDDEAKEEPDEPEAAMPPGPGASRWACVHAEHKRNLARLSEANTGIIDMQGCYSRSPVTLQQRSACTDARDTGRYA